MKKQPSETVAVRQRRKYDDEYKDRALGMLRNGRSAASVARELGISVGVMYKWKQGPKWTDTDAEVEQLRRRLKEVETERDILKKVVTIFSRPT